MKHLIVLVAFLIISSAYAVDESAAVLTVAQKGYKAFVNQCLNEESREYWGLSSSESAADALLGTPVKLMTIHPDAILNYKKGTNIESMLTYSNTYYVPVLFNGVIKIMLSVDKFPGKNEYEIGSVGHIDLAKEIVKMYNAWPLEKGYTPVLCVNYPTQIFSFTIPQLKSSNLTIIDPAKKAVYHQVDNLDNTMVVLNDQVTKFLKEGR